MASGSGSQQKGAPNVGSSNPSTPVAPSPPSYPPAAAPLPTRRTLFHHQSTGSPQRNPNDECFSCKRKGHWAQECPNKNPKKSPPGSSSSAAAATTNAAADLPLIRCPCGRGVCPVRTSGTEKNPNRKYFACPAGRSPPSGGQCKFFLWCDDLADFRAPKCPCGAGPCSLLIESSGPNAGRWYFACRLKKGHGACLFLLWADLRLNNWMNRRLPRNNGYYSPRSHQVIDTVNSNDSGDKRDQSSEMEPKFSVTQDFESSPNSPMVTVDLTQDVHNEVHGNLVTQVVNSSEPIQRNTFPISPIVSQSESHDCQTEFLRQISALGKILNEDVIYHFLGVQVNGWIGRLNFPPSQCLKDPAICCIFPSFDPVPDLEDVEMCDSEGPNFPTGNCFSLESDIQPPQTPPKDRASSRALLWEPSGLKNCPSSVHENHKDRLSRTILETFGQGLLDILESLNPVDHEKMLNVAEATFDALHRMSIDYGPFYEIVMEFILRSSKLAEIEVSMHKKLSSEELIDVYGGKKAQYDNVSHLHKEALDALKASEDRLKSLGEEVTRVKGMLFELEKRWCSCDAKTSELQGQVSARYEEMVEAEGSMEAACKEMEEALELEQQRDTEMHAAKAAFERARKEIKLVLTD